MPPAYAGFAAHIKQDKAKTIGSVRFKTSADTAPIASENCRMVVLPAGNRSGAYRTRKPFRVLSRQEISAVLAWHVGNWRGRQEALENAKTRGAAQEHRRECGSASH